MKKLISVALVFVMMFALAAVASAKDSPIAKDYFHVSIEIEGDGDAASDKDKVETTAVGEDGIVTLSANPESGNFTLWILDGDFDVVEGSEDSPVYKIRPHSDVHVTASFSQDKDNLTITAAASGDGKATADPEKVKKGSGNTVTLTAVDGKDTFSEWKLACKYDIVSGDLKSRKLVIKPYTDVHATAYFTGQGATEATQAPTEKKNTGNTAPKTGDPLFIVFGLAALALCGGVLAAKKLKKTS